MKDLANTHVMAPAACPECGKVMDRATGLTSDRKPEPGCVTGCIGCGAVLVFGEGLALRAPSLAEMVKWPADLHGFLE